MIKYLNELEKLDLGKEYVIVGSGVLAIRGIRVNKDLNILVSQNVFGRLKRSYPLNSNGGLYVGNVEVWNNFRPWFEDADFLIKHCDEILGYRFMRLRYFSSWKERSRRKKDLEDLRLLRNYLDNI